MDMAKYKAFHEIFLKNVQRIRENPLVDKSIHDIKERYEATYDEISTNVKETAIKWRGRTDSEHKSLTPDKRFSKSSLDLSLLKDGIKISEMTSDSSDCSSIQSLSMRDSLSSQQKKITTSLAGKSYPLDYGQSLPRARSKSNFSRRRSSLSMSNLAIESDTPVKEVVQKQMSDDYTTPKPSKASYTINEIANTEKDYVKDLELVITGYKGLMSRNEMNEVKMPKGLEGGKEKIVFGNLKDIYEWHKNTFCPKIIAASESDDCFNEICDLFIKYEKKLMRLYAIYCKNKPKSEYIVIEFQAYFTWCRVQLGEKFNLSDYLIKPVQRITKFNLLLKTLRDHLTKEKFLIGANLDQAVKIMSRIPKNANDMMKVGRLEDYAGDLPNELLLNDTLYVSELKGKSEKQMNKVSCEKLKVFLFEQKIIFSLMIGDEDGYATPRYKFKKEIKIDQIDLHKYRAEQRFILTFKDSKSPSNVLCVCPSPETYRSWVKNLDDLFKKQNAFIDVLVNPQFADPENPNNAARNSSSRPSTFNLENQTDTLRKPSLFFR